MTRYVLVLKLVLFCLWVPAAALAGAIAASGGNDGPLNVPLVLIAATMLMSTLAGATTLAMSIVAELKTGANSPVKPWLLCLSHMLGSWCAGALAFLGSMHAGVGVWALLSAVLMASFSGAKFLEHALALNRKR